MKLLYILAEICPHRILKASIPIRCSWPTCGIADRGEGRRMATNECDHRKPFPGQCCIHRRNVISVSGPFGDLHKGRSCSPVGQSQALSSRTRCLAETPTENDSQDGFIKHQQLIGEQQVRIQLRRSGSVRQSFETYCQQSDSFTDIQT